MINNKYISLVLPCKNEGNALREVLRKVPSQIDEIIVINNNSTDETEKTARKFGAKVLKEKRSKNGIGYGFSLAKGITASSGNIIVCMDGDDSYPVLAIRRLVETLDRDKLDFISCDRIPFRDKKEMSFVRTLGVKGLNLFFSLLFGYKIKDCLSGMWVFRREAVQNMNLFEGGWNFSLEIKLNAILSPRIRFAEKSIFYHDRKLDLSKQNLIKTGLQHLLFIFKTRFAYTKSGLSLLHPEPTVATA